MDRATYEAKVPCAAKGCGKDARAKGFCDTHYRRWRRTGDPNSASRRGHPDTMRKAWNTRRTGSVSKDDG